MFHKVAIKNQLILQNQRKQVQEAGANASSSASNPVIPIPAIQQCPPRLTQTELEQASKQRLFARFEALKTRILSQSASPSPSEEHNVPLTGSGANSGTSSPDPLFFSISSSPPAIQQTTYFKGKKYILSDTAYPANTTPPVVSPAPLLPITEARRIYSQVRAASAHNSPDLSLSFSPHGASPRGITQISSSGVPVQELARRLQTIGSKIPSRKQTTKHSPLLALSQEK